MKRCLILLLGVLLLTLVSCTNETSLSTTQPLGDYICKDTPLAQGCYVPANDLEFISVIPEEYLIQESFDQERVNATPQNWLLYRDPEYATEGVIARISQEPNGNRFVRMYSDGLKAPMFPQSAPTPTFIFSTKFNLDVERKGVAYVSIMIPSTQLLQSILGEAGPNDPGRQSNTLSVGVSSGAVNVIGVTITTDLKIQVKIGGPYFYYSGTADGGETITTSHTITKDEWVIFKFEWDASLNTIAAYKMNQGVPTLLHSGAFHISNRFNAEANNTILVPNVIRVTMPRRSSGWAFLDHVIVERKG